MRSLFLLMLFPLGVLSAPPDVKLPELVAPTPPAPPVPEPTSGPFVVSSDRVYMISSPEPITITSSLAGLLKVTVKCDPTNDKLPKAPYNIAAIFADGPNEIIEKSFPGPYVYRIEPAKTGEGELQILPRTVTGEGDIFRRQLKTVKGGDPTPPAPPVPPTPVESQLVKDLKAAVKADPDAKKVPALIAVFEKGVSAANSAVTWGDLFMSMQDEAKGLKVVAGELVAVQKVTGLYLTSKLPSMKAGDLALTDDDRKKAKAAFADVIAALKSAQ